MTIQKDLDTEKRLRVEVETDLSVQRQRLTEAYQQAALRRDELAKLEREISELRQIDLRTGRRIVFAKG